MRVLGVRIWVDKLAFVVVENADGSPVVVESWHGQIPNGSAGPARLKWIYGEVAGALHRCQVQQVGVKVAEPKAQRTDPSRCEGEGVAQLAALDAALPVRRCMRANMAKALGVTAKGAFAAYPTSDPVVSSLHADERDAAMAALSLLLASE